MKTDLDNAAGNILIVDDKPDNLRLLSNMLTSQGYKVRLAPNGKLALSGVQGLLPDLILMDIRMPGIDGYEATKEIRKFNQKVVIIAQTAFALSGDKEKAISAGCNDYLSKPIKKADLFSAIKKNLEKINTL